MLIIGPDPFFPQSSPEMIFHIMESRDQTSVLLSVTEVAIMLIGTKYWLFEVGTLKSESATTIIEHIRSIKGD